MKASILLVLSVLAVQVALAEDPIPALTVDGVTYSNVTFGTVTPVKVGIFRTGGISSLPLEKLSPELQKRFGYDPHKTASYRQAEQTQREQLAMQQAKEAQARREAKLKEQKDAEDANQLKEKCENAHSFTGGAVYIIQVLADGLLVRAGLMVSGGDRTDWDIFLVGYPNAADLVDGQGLSFSAYREGVYKFTTVMGASRTVQRWVYCSSPVKPPTSVPKGMDKLELMPGTGFKSW